MNKSTKKFILILFAFLISLYIMATKCYALGDEELAADAGKCGTSDAYFNRTISSLKNKGVTLNSDGINAYDHVGECCIEDVGGTSNNSAIIKTIVDLLPEDKIEYYVENGSKKTSDEASVVNVFKMLAYYSIKANSNREGNTDYSHPNKLAISALVAWNAASLENKGIIYSGIYSSPYGHQTDYDVNVSSKHYRARFLFLYASSNQDQLIYGAKEGVLKGNLTVEKVDKDWTGTNLANVQFRVKNDSKGWVKKSGSSISYVNSESNATTFTTNSEGKFEINNLHLGDYTIKEISNTHYGYNHSGNVGVTTKAEVLGTDSEVTIKNEKETGNLKIIKKDKDTGNTMSGVGFKIKCNSGTNSGNYIKVNSVASITGTATITSIEYKSSESDGTTFTTNSNGEIILYNILTGSYEIKEISAPYGYELQTKTVTVARQRSYATMQNSSTTGTGRPLGNGVYEIETILNSGKAVNVPTTNNGTNLTIKTKNNSVYQKFYLKWNDSKSGYRLRNLASNRNFALNQNNVSDGSNVQIRNNSLKKAHVWSFVSAGSGYYRIRSKSTIKDEDNNTVYLDVNVHEAKTDDGTPLKVKKKTTNNSTWQRFKFKFNPTISATVITIEDEKKTGNLQIIKVDKDTGNALENFSFKIKDSKGKYIKVNSLTESKGNRLITSMTKNDSAASGTTFKTDSNGKISLYNIMAGTYTIEEYAVPNDKYSIHSSYVWYQTSTDKGAHWTTETSGTSCSITVSRQTVDETKEIKEANIKYKVRFKNRRRFVDISGYVWEDILTKGKQDVRNDLFKEGENDSSDKKENNVDNIKVTLYNSSGTQMATTTTKDGGNYKFSKQEIDSLSGAYIEFEYNGMAYQCVVANKNKTNGSKAVEADTTTTETVVTNEKDAEVQVNNGTNGTGVTTTTDSSKYSKMNLWEHRYRDRAVVSYNESSKMNNISVTTDGGWEIIYLPIKTEAGKKYKVTFDYRNPNGYNTYSTYEGIAYQALTNIINGDCFSYSLSEKKYLPRPVNNNTQQLTLEFTATGTTTYFAINFGMAADYETSTVELGNFKVQALGTTTQTNVIANNFRQEFNNKFVTITNNNATSTTGTNTSLEYGFSDQASTLNYYGRNEMPDYTYLNPPITNVASKYIIKASTKTIYTSGIFGETAASIRSSGKPEIEYINLGIFKRAQPDLYLVADTESAKVTLNGYEHTYLYNQVSQAIKKGIEDKRNEENFDIDNFNVSVQFKKDRGRDPYTRRVYSSDVKYNTESEGALKMFVKYKIETGNESSSVYTRANSLVNYYDKNYTIHKITYLDESGNEVELQEGVDYVIDSTYGNSNTYNKVSINKQQKIAPQKVSTIYIEYQLNNDAINGVLNEDLPLNAITEITSYSTYSDSNYSVVHGGIDRDSNPGSADPANEDTHEDDTHKALPFKVCLEEGRVIKGTVWEDSAIADKLAKLGYEKQRIGNGKYDKSTENIINNVTVELLNANDLSLVKLYQYNAQERITIEDNEAIMTTGDKEAVCRGSNKGTDLENLGSYEFSGVIPGKYVLRFTYGNTSVIYDIGGTSLGEIGNEEHGGIDNYKSTLYRGGVAPNSLYWYREETSKDSAANRLSDAKDVFGKNKDDTLVNNIVEYRTGSIDNINYEQIVNTENQLDKISAESSQFDVKIDYDVNQDNISSFDADLKFVFDQMDFGIIRRPEQNVGITKKISYVELILNNGNTVVSGDPRTETLKGLQFYENGNIKIELDSELMQGAILKITYEIKVDNTDVEIDYNDPNYYIYYNAPSTDAEKKDKLKIAQITHLIDYPTNEMSVKLSDQSSEDSWAEVEVKATGEIHDGDKYYLIAGKNISTERHSNINIKDTAYSKAQKYSKILDTTAFSNLEPGESKTIHLVTSKKLSNKDDISLDNDVEANEYKERAIKDTTPGNYIPGLLREAEYEDVHEADDDAVNLTITPPTGEIRNYIPYIIIGTISFIILATGVVLIKKKVLRG